MYEVKYTHIRPSTEIAFYDFSNEVLSYIWENYSNKRIYAHKELSADELTFTQTTVWEDKAAYDQYREDLTVRGFFDEKRDYNLNAGISTQVEYRTL